MAASCAASAQVDESQQAEYKNELSRANTALHDRDYPSARAHYARANSLAHERSVEASLGLAWASLRMEDPKSALASAQLALRLASSDSEQADIHNLIGAIQYSEYVSDRTAIDKLHASEAEFRSAIRLNPSLASAHYNLGKDLLKEGQDIEGTKALQKYLELAPDAPNADEVKMLIANPRLSRGELAPAFSLQDTNGRSISTESLRGRVVLLDFWATWCAPCIASLPDIRRLASQFPPQQFALISINEDEDANAWKRFLTKESMPWPQVRDQDMELFHRFGLAPERKIVVPAYVILDREGLVQYKARGLEDAASLAQEIQKSLSAP